MKDGSGATITMKAKEAAGVKAVTHTVANSDGTTLINPATSDKQPSLGTAGSPSSNVITVQGVTSMTALKVDGSAVTQPVSVTFWQATQPVSGTFWQTTQPVSAAALPLGVAANLVLVGKMVGSFTTTLQGHGDRIKKLEDTVEEHGDEISSEASRRSEFELRLKEAEKAAEVFWQVRTQLTARPTRRRSWPRR